MSLAFSGNGQKLMAGFYFGQVKVWDLSGRTSEVTLRGHDWQVQGLALLPDGRTLVSASTDIRFWDLSSQRELFPPLKPRSTLFRGGSISPDGRRLAFGASDGIITIVDLASRQEVAALKGHEHQARFVAFLPDRNTLVSAGLDQLRVWRAASFAETDSLNNSEEEKKR
jgi:WD40 repeat protein